MKTLIFRLGAIALASAWAFACGSDATTAPTPQQNQLPAAAQPATQAAQPVQAAQPIQAAQPAPATQPAPAAQPGQPQNPMAGLMGALGALQGQQGANGAPTQKAIPWQSLVQALPVAAPGWVLDGETKGESVALGGFTTSNARCSLKQGTMTAKVEIVDTSLNPMLAMPFNMARAAQIDSSEERMGPINFGTYPGTQRFDKTNNSASTMVLVNNRVLINVEVTGAGSEAAAVGVMQYVNFAHLAQLTAG